jgi:hypothetical protein
MSYESKTATNQKNGQSAFEKNLMSDLIEEYEDNEKQKVHFDLKKIRRMHANMGYGIMAWDDEELQKRVDDLMNKGLIDGLHNGEYQISDNGIQWKDDNKPPI